MNDVFVIILGPVVICSIIFSVYNFRKSKRPLIWFLITLVIPVLTIIIYMNFFFETREEYIMYYIKNSVGNQKFAPGAFYDFYRFGRGLTITAIYSLVYLFAQVIKFIYIGRTRCKT